MKRDHDPPFATLIIMMIIIIIIIIIIMIIISIITIIVVKIANEPLSEDARLVRRQPYRAVRKYCEGGENLQRFVR